MVTKSSCARSQHPRSPARALVGRWHRRVRPALGRGFLLVLICCGGATRARAADADATLDIGVRSAVMPSPAGTPAAQELRELPGHSRLYAILAVSQVTSGDPLVKPVDEVRLIHRLLTELNANGFQPAESHQTPEILLTVVYGRGWLRNPYLRDSVSPTYDTNKTPVLHALNTSGEMATQSVDGLTTPYIDGMSPGHEAALQKASYEKLFLRVTAFDYGSDPTARAHLRWMTTMVVDDPGRRDLNTIAPQMLAAGAHYFGRAMTERELTFTVAEPAGRVRVGIPEVVGAIAAATGPAPAAPVVAPPPPTVLRKQFDLPPGEATATLQAFSRQSGEEIIYPAEQVRAVRTQAVNGEFSARAALDRMLDQTGLVAEWDEKSGIFIIHRASR